VVVIVAVEAECSCVVPAMGIWRDRIHPCLHLPMLAYLDNWDWLHSILGVIMPHLEVL
jgi:hypothetical protein